MLPVEALDRAIDARADLLAELGADTDGVRLLHGIAEGLPGVAVDRYGPILLIQTWREPLSLADVEALHRLATDRLGTTLHACFNHRKKERNADFRQWHDPLLPAEPEVLEYGLRFDARPRHTGIDPLLFLDFRVGRRWVRDHAAGAHVLNLFAYTCGIGVAALAGGAASVWNVDFAQSALTIGRANARRNDLDDQVFATVHSDVFPIIRQFAGLPVGGRRRRTPRYQKHAARQFDLVVLDPPRWAKTPWGAVDVVGDYPSLLKPCVLATRPGGHLLVTNNAAQVSLEAWLDVLRRCAEKCGRPIRSMEVLQPDSDFPSFDGQPPLKLAWLEV